MIYLLDVNALLALGVIQHQFHERVSIWARKVSGSVATCSITELGFVRVLAQTPQYGVEFQQARMLLRRMKSSAQYDFTFLPDDQDITQLPEWVNTPGQSTDGHLAQLAKAKNGVLATLDKKIPESLLIPSL
jgi:uncharacterized protein